MMHDIDVLGCGAIYIDGERAFGSKPYGLFSTVTWKASDEDLKRISDRCLEVIANTPQTEEFKNFDREDLILLIECQKERIGELLADKDTPQTESTGSPIGDYRDGVGAWQTDCGWGEPNE